MKKYLPYFLAAVFFLLTFCAQAADRTDFRLFSLELPDGWEMASQPAFGPRMATVAFMSQKNGEPAFLTVSYTVALAEDVRTLAKETARGMASGGLEMTIIETTDSRVVSVGEHNGIPVRLIMTLDSDTQEQGMILMMGNEELFEEIIKSIVPVNSKLDFF